MVQMESSRVFKTYIDHLRFDKPSISFSLLFLMITAASIMINTFLVILTPQTSKGKCLMAIKDLLLMIASLTSVGDVCLNPRRTLHLVNLIDRECLVNCKKLADREMKWKMIEECYNEKKRKMEKLFKNISYVVIGVYIGAVNRNLFNSLFGGAKTRDWPTPFIYWCPTGYDNFTVFILIYISHSLLLLIMCFQGYFVEVLVCLATEKVLADFETIILLLEGIATDFPDLGEDCMTYLCRNKSYRMINEELKRDMDLIVECHQTLTRNFKDCNEISAYGILVNTFTIGIDTIFNIYLMLKADDLGTCLSYGAASFFINLIGFFRFHTGHGIVDQNDVFRQSLSNIPWTDKPQWFKKTLIIMMERANKNIQLNPYNIFILNHKSFNNIMKSVFSYGNFLYNRHSMSNN